MLICTWDTISILFLIYPMLVGCEGKRLMSGSALGVSRLPSALGSLRHRVSAEGFGHVCKRLFIPIWAIC